MSTVSGGLLTIILYYDLDYSLFFQSQAATMHAILGRNLSIETMKTRTWSPGCTRLIALMPASSQGCNIRQVDSLNEYRAFYTR